MVHDSNVSHVNLDNISLKNSASWDTIHDFIGMPISLSGQLSDGINSEGLYMGALYLPGMTDYPKYNPKNSKKALVSVISVFGGGIITLFDASNHSKMAA